MFVKFRVAVSILECDFCREFNGERANVAARHPGTVVCRSILLVNQFGPGY